ALLRHFIDTRARRGELLMGCCDALSAPRPLGPLIDMCNGLPSAAAVKLREALDSENNEPVYERVLEVLRDGHRWICVIEDAHWADGATLDILRFLARRIETLPVLVVVTYRDEELGQDHPLAMMLGDMSNHTSVTRISLSPLTIESVRVMAAGSEVDSEQIYLLTGGNPFYVNELLEREATGSTSGALPRSVVESARGRLARLSVAAREAAEVAAVCGPDVDHRLVEKLCSGAVAALNECVHAGLLVARGEVVRFRHELIRLATLEQIPDYLRAHLHRRALMAQSRPLTDAHPPGVKQSGRPFGAATATINGHRPDTRADPHRLTRREHEILELLAVGHSDAEIAGRLFISQRTVNNHVHAILNKLGAHNRTQAATYVHQRPIEVTEPQAAQK
ncbi:MAG: LuxR C-terminal-related transcriptional regulator, partial [Mycobacterium sp.]